MSEVVVSFSGGTLWDLFTRTAQRHAGAVALRDEEQVHTYRELHQRCLAVAGALAAADVAPGDPVLLCTGHTRHGVLALLGAYAAGAVPVPVEPDGPARRLAHIVASSGARVALVDQAGRAAAAAVGLSPVDLADAVRARPYAADLPPPRPGDLAYLLFTSGSTGEPKGVEVTRANLLSLLDGAARWDTSTRHDVWACFHAFTFDVSMWEIWRPLSTGAQLYVLPRAAQLDGDLLYTLVGQRGVTSLCQTPTAARLLALRVCESGPPRDLRRLLLAGERLDFGVLAPLRPAVAGGRLEIWNVYGPTEATVYATAYQVSAADITAEARSLIGRPLPGVQAEVHAPDPGGTGELWLSGESVAAGYRGDARLTAERFVTDRAGRRAYRTGDLVRDTGGGVLEFIGRIGGFVKVRGFRIEPGEVTAAMTAHPAVDEAAVLVTNVLGWGETLVCAVVPRPGAAVSELELRRHAAQTLPGYLRPGRIVLLDRLPRLPSAKLDPHALRRTVEARLAERRAVG